MKLLGTAGVIGLLVFLAAAAGGPGDLASDGYKGLFVALFIVPALLCLARALLVAQQRLPWTLFGLGMLSWAAAQAVYFIVYHGEPNAPSPSVTDAFWLTSYCFSLAAALALMKTGFVRVPKNLWIDVVLGGLAIATIAGVLLVPQVLDSTDGSLGAVITNLAYPLMDVLMLALLIGVLVLSSGRPGRVWILIAVAWLAQTALDTTYLYQAASGEYSFGTLLDAGWPALMLLLAYASWHRPAVVVTAPETADRGMLALTGVSGIIGLALTTFNHWHELDIPYVLATLTLVAAFVRTTERFAELRARADTRVLSTRTDVILDAAGEGILGTDSEGSVTFVNPAASRMIGYAAEELVGRDLHSTIHHTKADGTAYPLEECAMHASLRDGTIHHSDRDVYWRKDGTSYPVEYTSTPIVRGASISGAVVVFHDISERREVQRVKDEFTSVVSHELRTPLTSIRGSLGLLESGTLGALPETAERMIHIAVQNTDRLVRLINDILDLERLDAGAMPLRASPCDGAQLVARAAEAMLPTAVHADVTLAVDAAPATFDADADGLIQTLTNLIGNAVKFSPPGATVQISAQRRSGEMLFSVRDRGRGIPATQLESIFGRFAQVDSSDSRQSGGTGLGLAICRSIVEHHGGRIWATSAVGEGSTFSFVVPAAVELSDEYRPSPGGDRGSVLICDDNPAILEVTGTALTERGYRVILAHSGEQAIERAIAELPDVILLDLVMPGLSGEQTVTAIREHSAIAHIPVVVLSVLPRSGEDMASYALADWIEKPAAPDALFAALDRAIGHADEAFRVLVVERDPAIAELLMALFQRHGVASFASTGGPHTLELCAQVEPDLIVLDNEVPDVDGVDVEQWLLRDPRLSALPMARYDAGDVEDAERSRSAVGSVTQMLTRDQITPEEFQWRVMTLLARPRGARRSPEAHS